LATAVWLKIKRLPLLPVADAWAPCATLVWSFLALGHLCDGSDPGMQGLPVALFAAAYASLLTGALLLWLNRHGQGTAALGLAGAGLGQFVLSFWREPDPSGLTTLLDPLQWLAVGMMIAAAVLVVGRSSVPSV
jgi:phosphatidylglycerol:prolipoprotein diacylglycerol transferase